MKKIYLLAISLLLTTPAFTADNIIHGGAIARSPALVVANPTNLNGRWGNAVAAKSSLEKLGYKIYDNKIISTTWQNKDAIENGIKCSSIFFYSGHHDGAGILTDKIWYLESGTVSNLVANDYQYRFVFLDGCETIPHNNPEIWPTAFKINAASNSGEIFLGWRETVFIGSRAGIINFLLFGRSHKDPCTFVRRMWESLKQKNTVLGAADYAGDHFTTSLVKDTYGFDWSGDYSLRLK